MAQAEPFPNRKRLAHDAGTAAGVASSRFLIVTEMNNPSQVVLRQAAYSKNDCAVGYRTFAGGNEV